MSEPLRRNASHPWDRPGYVHRERLVGERIVDIMARAEEMGKCGQCLDAEGVTFCGECGRGADRG